jgi:hypothetical protein
MWGPSLAAFAQRAAQTMTPVMPRSVEIQAMEQRVPIWNSLLRPVRSSV